MVLASPVYGERALTIGRSLAVAELHIGMEHDMRKKGTVIPSQTKNMEERLISLIERTKAEELIIVGDIKHNIPSISLQEYREVPDFLTSLGSLVKIIVVKGNHDGNLERLLPEVSILEHYGIEGVLFTHGHTWIKAESIDAGVVVLAHSHPAVVFVDEFSKTSKEPVWIRGSFNEKIRERYIVKEPPEFIVMPAFNQLVSGMPVNRSLNRNLLGPYFNSGIVDSKTAHAYLLDGTDLGKIGDLDASK